MKFSQWQPQRTSKHEIANRRFLYFLMPAYFFSAFTTRNGG